MYTLHVFEGMGSVLCIIREDCRQHRPCVTGTDVSPDK